MKEDRKWFEYLWLGTKKSLPLFFIELKWKITIVTFIKLKYFETLLF